MKKIILLLLSLLVCLIFCGCEKEETYTQTDMNNFSLDDLSLSEKDQYDRLCYCINQVCSYELTEDVAFQYAKYYKAGKIASMDVSRVVYLEDVNKDSPKSIGMRHVVVFLENASVWFEVNRAGCIERVFAYTGYESLMLIIE